MCGLCSMWGVCACVCVWYVGCVSLLHEEDGPDVLK